MSTPQVTVAPVHIDERKWPDNPHWQFGAERLGEDEHGVWLYAPSDTIVRRGDEPPRQVETGFVIVVPRDTWWIAEFYWDHPLHSVYVNIGTPPVWHGDRMTQIDLDLDVVRTVDGTVEVLDEDEFADHQVRYGYPQDLIDRTVEATAVAVDLLVRGTEPFATVGQDWIDFSPKA
ncbi:MAG: DUF402 domain-containing protein [bacterium]|nr:DUF402 domain-containing protein [bacterium]